MPFKLKLKKSRQYNVTSKSLFVISVHHLLVLDTPTTVDCTLSSESTGQECLDNVCQRLSIQQLEFFGLRYVVKDSDELRWVDLERPLSRQLDKYAASPRLYLRVMYYVISGVSLISDEVARNYYFLQLKSDVVDGRIACDPKQAVILAIYCRQAQYDSHQSERHTVDYLKTLLPFPRHMIEAGLLETLTEEVLKPNADVQKLTQSAAEGLFIGACQQLDGYGQEKFGAKDESGVEVVLGITVSGVAVQSAAPANTEFFKFYPWHEISNVVNHKRTFNIECTVSENSVGFTLGDADTGRYFWKLCVLQHTFYMKYEQPHKLHHMPDAASSISLMPAGNMNLFASATPDDPYDSRDNLFLSEPSNLHHMYASDSHLSTIGLHAGGSTAALHNHQQHQQQPHHQQQQHWQPPNDSAVSSNISLAASQQHLRAMAAAAQAATKQQVVTPSLSNSNWGVGSSAAVGGDGVGNGGGRLTGSMVSMNNRGQSTSCLDLSNNNSSSTVSQERERLKALLPGYRPAPDYETAMHQKYANSESELRQHHQLAGNIAHSTAAGLLSDPYLTTYSGSQPDVHRATSVADAIFGKQLQQQYPDVTHTTNPMYQHHLKLQQQPQHMQHQLHVNGQQQQQQQPQQHLHYVQHSQQQNFAHNQLHHSQQQLQQQQQHQKQQQQQQQQHVYNGVAAGDVASEVFAGQLNRFSKPPPPYTANRLSSTSTPDLAVASHRAMYGSGGGGGGYQRGAYVSGSSPDLVSTRTFLHSQYMKHPSILPPAGVGGGGAAGGLQQQLQQQSGGGGGGGSNAFRYRYSQGHIAHGTYENLNTFLESPQTKASMLTQQLHQAAAAAAAAASSSSATGAAPGPGPMAAYRLSSSHQHLSHQYAAAAGSSSSSSGGNGQLIKSQQMLTRNGSIEPIYENVPLPRNSGGTAVAAADARGSDVGDPGGSHNNNEMRDRTSSIQSAPGVMRYNQKPPLIGGAVNGGGSMNVLNDANTLNFAALGVHDEADTVYDRRNGADGETAVGSGGNRAAQVLVHRSVSKSTSNPIYIAQHAQKLDALNNSSQNSTLDTSRLQTYSINTIQPANSPLEPANSSINSLRSQSVSQISSSVNSSYLGGGSGGVTHRNHSLTQNSSMVTTQNTTATSSTTDISSSAAADSARKDKKKRRWGFFGGSKTSLSGSDKPKSATLGRQKEKATKSALALEEESNLRHRWSTGLPRSPVGPEPVPVTMSKEKLCQILETKLSDPQLYVEFECIPKRKESARYESALHDENRTRNIDPNFLPYDDNRVHLTPSRENRLGYVNASHVSATVGSKQRFYVVAQSPSATTLTTFLQCVWEADVYLLVQLSDEVSYVPATSSKCLEYGQYQVWQEFSQVTDRCTTSKLRLYHTASRRYRSVWHLNYSDWAEQNCPKDVAHFLDFLEELNSVRLAAVNEVPPGHNSNPPVMIHCSEGGGRGGIALAADLLLYTLDHNQDLDIPRVVSQLRHQRDNIIPSLAQYKFMYALLIHYLKRTRLI